MGVQTWTAAARFNLDNVYMLAAVLLILAPIGQQLNDILTRIIEHRNQRHTLATYNHLANELAKDLT